MGDMGKLYKAMRRRDKKRRYANLENADLTGFTKHNEWHYSRMLNGTRLDYWPSRNRFRWNGKTYTGDVHGFIRNREGI